MKKIVLGITGASGAIYAKKLVEVLENICDLHIICSKTAALVFKEELDLDLNNYLKDKRVSLHKLGDFLSPLASGSNHFDSFLIAPCSMKTVAQVASGVGETLLFRVADIALKERRQLILMAREAPYSTLHLQNMLKVSELGAIICPASPGFYHKPQNIDDLVSFLVNRLMQLMGFRADLVKPWKS